MAIRGGHVRASARATCSIITGSIERIEGGVRAMKETDEAKVARAKR